MLIKKTPTTEVTTDSPEVDLIVSVDVEAGSKSRDVCTANEPREVVAVKKEYSIVGDSFYAGTNSSAAPTWLTDLLTSVVDDSVTSGLRDYDLLVQDVRNAISSIDVAKNTYVEQINFTSTVDGIIGTHLDTLNTTYDSKFATITNLDVVRANSESALVISANDIRAEFSNEISSRITDVQQAFSDASGANADSISALFSAFTDQEGVYSGMASAVSGLQTYVGLGDSNHPTGTGMLARVALVEKQTDGTIEYITGTHNVMGGIENPNTNTENDRLITDALPYAQWTPMEGNGIPDMDTRPYWNYTAQEPGIAYIGVLEGTVYENLDFTVEFELDEEGLPVGEGVDVDRYYIFVSGSWENILEGEYFLKRDLLRSAHIADAYIKYQSTGITGEKTYVNSYKFIKTEVDETSPTSTDTEGYTWAVVTDTDVQAIYMSALNAQAAADGKISQFFAWGGPTQPEDYDIVTRPATYSANEYGEFLDLNGEVTTDPEEYVVTQEADITQILADDFTYWFFEGDLYTKGPNTDIFSPDFGVISWLDKLPVPTAYGNGKYVAEGDLLSVWDTSPIGVEPDTVPANVMQLYAYTEDEWKPAGPEGMVSLSRFFVDLENSVNGPNGVSQAISNLETTSAARTDKVESKFAYNSKLLIDGLYYNSGFGLDSSAVSQTEDGSSEGTALDSEFWVNAKRFVLKSPEFPDARGIFQMTSTGLMLSIDQTEATRNELRGDYSAGDSYIKGDIVSYNGSSYSALRSVTGVTPVHGDDWQLMASIGYSGIGVDYWFKRSDSAPNDTPNADGSDANGWYTDLGDSALNAEGSLYSIKGIKAEGSGIWAFGTAVVTTGKVIRELRIYSAASLGTVPIPNNSRYNFVTGSLEIGASEGGWSTTIGGLDNSGEKIYTTTFLVSGNNTQTSVPVTWNPAVVYASRIDGDTIFEVYEYSPDGSADWNSDLRLTDYYRRTATVTNGIQGSWSNPVRIRVDGINPAVTDNGNGTYTVTDGDGNSVIITDGDSATIPTVTDNGNGTVTIDDGDGNSVVISEGATPKYGFDYFDGKSGNYISYVYKNVATSSGAPSKPSNGSFDGINETLPTSPSGWSDTFSPEDGKITYVSKNIYVQTIHPAVGATPAYKSWSTPDWSTAVPYIHIPKEGVDFFKADGSFKSFIFRTSISRPSGASLPTGGTFTGSTEIPPVGWSDDPYFTAGRITWVCSTLYTQNPSTKAWSNNGWSAPSEYSRKGDTGDKGDKGDTGDALTVETSSSNGVTTFTFSDGTTAEVSEGSNGVSSGVTMIFSATGGSGSSLSFTQGTRKYVSYYEWTGTAPVSIPAGLTYTKFIGEDGDNAGVIPIYHTSTSGTGSFIQGAREYVNFYEWTGSPPSTVPSGLTYVKFVGSAGVPGEKGARGTAIAKYSIETPKSNPHDILNTALYWNAAAPAEYVNEVAGDTLVLTNTHELYGWTHIFEYTGSEWIVGNTYTVNGNQLVKGTVVADSLVTGMVIADDAVIEGRVSGGKGTFMSSDPGYWLGKSGNKYVFSVGGSESFIRWDGSGLTVKGDIAFGSYIPSSNPIVSSSSLKQAYSQTYEKIKEFKLTTGGTVNVSLEARAIASQDSYIGTPGYFQIRVNGSVKHTDNINRTATGHYYNFSVNIGDSPANLEVWAKSGMTGGNIPASPGNMGVAVSTVVIKADRTTGESEVIL